MSDVIAAAKGANDALCGIQVWLPVISALAGGALTGGVALLVSRLNHRYARELADTALRNETRASEEKLNRERYFIGTELVFKLEEYAEKSAYVGLDKGSWHDDVFNGFFTRGTRSRPAECYCRLACPSPAAVIPDP